ncbi:stalk domain-containing protein [Heliorestis convoluta]|uniref:Metallo beta lactamase family protein n=1 Tax=Heliorestis convoluta TaxID=356322 RepID=A0A5Q2N1B1_9FIRM|nr:stalk domain-containing protein [Heliorestis convoluta]QGG46335.1 Metallo beta lactamase family protein [Heliorestis convoluta]
MRNYKLFLVVVLAVFLFTTPSMANGISVIVNDSQVDFGDVSPQIVDNRTLVPLRATFEALGASLEWIGEEQKVIAFRGNNQIELVIGVSTAIVNGNTVQLDVPAKIINGRTLVPLRFIGEALGDDVRWDGQKRAAVITSKAFSIEAPSSSEKDKLKDMTVHFIDVGQGDSIFVISPNGATMLIDAGTQTAGQKIVSYLKKAGITSIDKVVATHPHADHIGGMQAIFDNFKVKKVYDSGFPHTSQTYENFLITVDEKNIPFEIAHRGNKINLDPDLDIMILHPGTTMGDANNNSIVLKVTYGQVSYLFTGDAEKEAEEMMLEYVGSQLNSTVLKVGHHGSSTSTTKLFLDAVKPKVAVIQVGEGNSYGHPTNEVLNRLYNASVNVFRNDIHGTVVISTDGQTYSVKTEKQITQPVLPVQAPIAQPIMNTDSVNAPSTQERLININTADYELIQKITGVGPAIAKNIIDYREKHGAFTSIEQIKRVSGIGDARFEAMKHQITVN